MKSVAPVHNPFLQHHFTEMEQQVDAGKIGMWLFLVTEVLLFGGLFVGYGIMAGKHPEAFRAAHTTWTGCSGAQHRGAAGEQLHHGDGGASARARTAASG